MCCLLFAVWRQLWRVCERSDILLVVVDSRQPLLNFPPSLYHYITQTLRKPMVIVLNKIDLLPAQTVNDWIDFFHKRFPKLFVVPFTSFPTERRETLDGLVKSKAKSVEYASAVCAVACAWGCSMLNQRWRRCVFVFQARQGSHASQTLRCHRVAGCLSQDRGRERLREGAAGVRATKLLI